PSPRDAPPQPLWDASRAPCEHTGQGLGYSSHIYPTPGSISWSSVLKAAESTNRTRLPMMSGRPSYRALVNDGSARGQSLPPGITGRVISYARPHWRSILVFVLVTSVAAGIVVANPLLLRAIIDQGVLLEDSSLVVWLALAAAGLAVLEAGMTLTGRWLSSRIGEGVIYTLRTQVFTHVQRMPLSFFTRTQTGSLISRLNTDVVGAQRAITSVLQSVVSNLISGVAVIVTMLALSWQVTLIALALVPLFLM